MLQCFPFTFQRSEGLHSDRARESFREAVAKGRQSLSLWRVCLMARNARCHVSGRNFACYPIRKCARIPQRFDRFFQWISMNKRMCSLVLFSAFCELSLKNKSRHRWSDHSSGKTRSRIRMFRGQHSVRVGGRISLAHLKAKRR